MHVHWTPLFYHALTGVEHIAVDVDHLGGIFQRCDLLLLQTVGVDFTRRRVLLDLLVHQRLGCARLVGFVVAVTAVAHQVNKDVAFKGVTKIQCEAGHECYRFRIVSVNVENRRLDHFTDIGTVRRGARIERIGGGEAHLVVDNDAHRAAHFVAAGFGHVQRFLHHALAGYRRVTVNGDRQDFVAARLVEAIETRTHGAHHYRADNLQVRRVKRQRQVNQTALGFDIGREAHVVLHVAGAKVLFMLARKLVEQILGLLTQHVDQHVETTTVRHTQHHFTRAALAGVADHLFQHRDQRVAALQREAFRPRELGSQIALHPLRRRQLAEEAFFLFRREGRAARHGLNPLLDPALLFGAGDMHILSADRAAVGLLQRRDQLTQRHGVFAKSKGADVKALLQIRFGEIVISRVEIGNAILFPQPQRIEVRLLVTAEAVGVDELQDFYLLNVGVRVGERGGVT